MSNEFKKIDLNTLMLFYEVVKAEGVRQGAARANVPRATVSRKLRELEEQVGAVLLKRGPRKLGLTESGIILYEYCERIVGEVQSAAYALSQRQTDLRGPLRVSVPVGFGTQWVSKAIARFALAHPMVDLQVQVTHKWVDVSEEPFDVAVHVGRIRNENLPVMRLGHLGRSLYGGAEYLERVGPPTCVSELSRFDYIALDSQIEDKLWPSCPDVPGTGRKPPRIRVSDVAVAYEMALAGLGLAILPDVICDEAVKFKSLVQLLPDWNIPPLMAAATYLERRHLPVQIRAFLEFLQSDLKACTSALQT